MSQSRSPPSHQPPPPTLRHHRNLGFYKMCRTAFGWFFFTHCMINGFLLIRDFKWYFYHQKASFLLLCLLFLVCNFSLSAILVIPNNFYFFLVVASIVSMPWQPWFDPWEQVWQEFFLIKKQWSSSFSWYICFEALFSNFEVFVHLDCHLNCFRLFVYF